MNKFAWNLTFSWSVDLDDFPYNLLEIESESWNTVVYTHWETWLDSSSELISQFKEHWTILNSDISISSEKRVTVLSEDFWEWIYELASFEWVSVNYKEIKDRFIEVYEVLSIREAEVSEKYWNKIVKVDFVY